MSKRTKQPVERVHEFHCCEQAMKHPDFIAHLQAEHGYIKGTQARRSLVQALDGSGWYSNIFEWEIPCGDKTIKAQEVSSGPRGRDDMMNCEGE